MFLRGGVSSLKTTIIQLLVLLLPTQLGYHFWPKWAYVFGIRIDYLSPTVYLTDLIVFVLALTWLFEKKKEVLLGFIKPVFLLGIFALINSLMASFPIVSFLKWLKIAELIFVSFVIATDKNIDLKKVIVFPLAFSCIVVLLVAIAQLALQRSIGGPLYLLGERAFTSGTPGISLYSIFDRSLLRPYSIFSHPNSMAGFVGVALLLFLGLLKGLRQKDWLGYLGVFASLVALLLSGSKAAFGGIVLVVGFYILARSREGLIKKFLVWAAATALLASMVLPLIANKISTKGVVFSERVNQRLVLADVAGRLYSQKPFVGVGLNNFIPRAAGVKTLSYYSWYLQPVHNVPLLVLVETGLVGFTLFVWFLFKLIKRSAATSVFFALSIVFILVTAFLDHYWLTLQQNQLLLAVFIGVIYRANKKRFLLN